MYKFKLPSPRKAALVSSAVMTVAMPFTAHQEGLRTAAYLDAVGIPTICYGETVNVKLGDTKTKAECDALFYARLGSFAYAVDLEVQPDMRPEFHAALTSWAYNVGLDAMRTSTLIRLANKGDFKAACAELPRWKFSRGQPILAARRERERQLCMKGV